MSQYPKIYSPWKRDHKTGKFLLEWSRPEFELLADVAFDWSEKLDGTNIRVFFEVHEDGTGWREIRGRTDRAELQPGLEAAICDLLPVERLKEQFEHGAVLYGEGIGPRIQKGGGLLSPGGPTFVLFDVRVGETWLTRAGVDNVANELGLLWAPEHGTGTLWDAADYVKRGFNTELPGAVEGTPAEGLVLRPEHELLDRRAHRIITKIKTKDFK